MNRYESIILDKMVDVRNRHMDSVTAHGFDAEEYEKATAKVLLLLDCICEFREPPRALDVGEGYGALVGGVPGGTVPCVSVDLVGEVVE